MCGINATPIPTSAYRSANACWTASRTKRWYGIPLALARCSTASSLGCGRRMVKRGQSYWIGVAAAGRATYGPTLPEEPHPNPLPPLAGGTSCGEG